MKKTLAIAILLFFIDAYFLNQGVLALVFLVVVVPTKVISALFSFRDKEAMRQKFVSAGIYGAMAALVLIYIQGNNKMAGKRADLLVAACKQYHLNHGVYPDKLTDLVPDYCKKIPMAKYAYTNSRFHYITDEDSHILWYTVFPPFGRCLYGFETGDWGYLD